MPQKLATGGELVFRWMIVGCVLTMFATVAWVTDDGSGPLTLPHQRMIARAVIVSAAILAVGIAIAAWFHSRSRE